MRLRAVPNSRRTAASSARPSASITSFHRASSRSLSQEQTWPMVCVAKSSPPPGLSRIEPAIASCSRAQATMSSPGCVSSSLGRRIYMRPLFSGKRAEWLAGEPVHSPLGVGFRAEALVEPDRVLVPVEHGPLEPAAAAVDRHLRQTLEQHATDAATAMLGHDEEILEVETRLGEEGRERVKKESEADRLAVVICDQRLRVAPFAEEMSRQPFLCHDHFVLELLVAREPADQLRDQGHGSQLAGPNANCHLGRSPSRKTKRNAPWDSEKLAILLSTSPAARPAWVRSVSRGGLRPPLGRTTQMAPLGSIQVFASFNFSRSRISLAPMKTMSHGVRGLPRTMSDVRDRSTFMNQSVETPATPHFAPGFTPSLSSRGRVDATSGLILVLPHFRRESRRRR